ncbi:MAG: GatB/YqeY domain-containing protein [Cytophagia bacterium]|nr:MAG: GatB/YqeY domain-containing protein [Cytophagia bacterium]TAG44023.1 MAG: GatB/YqeY domain-containing protein [Cytophagia bacterium]TAH30971.1 MAG: GatB/YqeY domain-containing protein [Cytophagales bacterium]
MALKATIEDGIKKAMLAKDADRLRALRAIKSLILLEETKEGKAAAITEADELSLLMKAAKQRKDSIDIFTQQNRNDLAEKEIVELKVIEEFLPKQLNEAEIIEALNEIIARVGASKPADMGKVMGVATKEFAGKADGKLVAQLVKQLLNN